MAEIFSQAFVIGVLLFYAALVLGMAFWSAGQRLRRAGKRRVRPASVQHPAERPILHRPTR